MKVVRLPASFVSKREAFRANRLGSCLVAAIAAVKHRTPEAEKFCEEQTDKIGYDPPLPEDFLGEE